MEFGIVGKLIFFFIEHLTFCRPRIASNKRKSLTEKIIRIANNYSGIADNQGERITGTSIFADVKCQKIDEIEG
jgi:hypothetical protein